MIAFESQLLTSLKVRLLFEPPPLELNQDQFIHILLKCKTLSLLLGASISVTLSELIPKNKHVTNINEVRS